MIRWLSPRGTLWLQWKVRVCRREWTISLVSPRWCPPSETEPVTWWSDTSRLPIPLFDPQGGVHGYLCPRCGAIKGWGARWQGRPWSSREDLDTRAKLNLAYAYLSANDCATQCQAWT